MKILGMSSPSCKIFTGGFDRPNLKFEVCQKPFSQGARSSLSLRPSSPLPPSPLFPVTPPPPPSAESFQFILQIIRSFPPSSCGILYCMTKNETEKLSDFLRDNEISADYYHAGMTKNIKQNVQAAWLEEKIHVVCATIAYGTLSLTQSLSVSLSLDLTRPLSLPLSLGARDGDRQAQCAVRHSRLIGEELRGLLSGEANARRPSPHLIH
jgi:hypothetical protein